MFACAIYPATRSDDCGATPASRSSAATTRTSGSTTALSTPNKTRLTHVA
jgi:hypothetical protein